MGIRTGIIFLMEENEKNKKGLQGLKEPWWKSAVQLWSEFSTWIAGPIVMALIAGKALDKHYGTKPWIFISFTLVSFAVSCYGIFRTVNKYMNKIKIEDSQKKTKEINFNETGKE